MKLLAVDTSGPVCGVAVLADGAIVYECSVTNKLTHSTNLMPMIDQALTMSGLTLKELDYVAVVTGPGSFTGVRIGVSTVKGLCHGAGIPCVTVDALEAMAAGINSFSGVVCPIQDARAGQVYGAAFHCENGVPERLMDDIPLKIEEYVSAISSFGNRFLFLGDGMPVHHKRLTELLGEQAVFAEPQQAFLRPAAAANLAAAKKERLTWKELEPMYLRAPNAERCKKLVEAANE
ncbi:MAG: tRNA (adenosine(37)-N6)-threonylcarbamoyltransferase complex dimerization subunit type 1 TsaB [Clostridia bacterium]|nr:tRNA (adenosine(37)-N6)-threonylcarbamoyltransferase complex dimerization subunit type 1 TsaB [Clostridia bacterium]